MAKLSLLVSVLSLSNQKHWHRVKEPLLSLGPPTTNNEHHHTQCTMYMYLSFPRWSTSWIRWTNNRWPDNHILQCFHPTLKIDLNWNGKKVQCTCVTRSLIYSKMWLTFSFSFWASCSVNCCLSCSGSPWNVEHTCTHNTTRTCTFKMNLHTYMYMHTVQECVHYLYTHVHLGHTYMYY